MWHGAQTQRACSTMSDKVSDAKFLQETLGPAHADGGLDQQQPPPRPPASAPRDASPTPVVTFQETTRPTSLQQGQTRIPRDSLKSQSPPSPSTSSLLPARSSCEEEGRAGPRRGPFYLKHLNAYPDWVMTVSTEFTLSKKLGFNIFPATKTQMKIHEED